MIAPVYSHLKWSLIAELPEWGCWQAEGLVLVAVLQAEHHFVDVIDVIAGQGAPEAAAYIGQL